MAIRINLTVNQNGKKNIYLTTLLLGFLIISQPTVNGQEKKKVIDRPSTCDVKNIDDFVSKTFDTYDESQKISEDLRFIKVEGDGKTAPIKVTNGKGESISKETALIQFGDLLVRAKKQNDYIKTLQELQKPAQESLKKCPLTQKPKATKSLSKGGEALNEVVKQTKEQIELIEKQIADIKTIKDSK